jgi:hypothetical protein
MLHRSAQTGPAPCLTDIFMACRGVCCCSQDCVNAALGPVTMSPQRTSTRAQGVILVGDTGKRAVTAEQSARVL